MTLGYDDLKSRLKSTERTILDRFLKEEEDEIERTTLNAINTEIEHTYVVNSCAYAFTESGPARATGFHFIRVEPLYSFKEDPRFDLAIYDPKQETCVLIECKSSVSDATNVLKQMSSAATFADDHRTELEKEIGYHISRIESVLCAPAHAADSVLEALRSGNQPIIVWSLDRFSDTLKLHKAGENIGLEIRNRRLHQDDGLRRTLFDGVESSGTIIHLLPSSHMCLLLQEIIIALQSGVFERRNDQERQFNLSDIQTALTRELLNFEVNEIESLSKKILESGIACDIFLLSNKRNPDDMATWTLNVPFDTRGPGHIIKNTQGLYIRFKQNQQAKQGAVERYERYAESRPDRLQF